MAAWIAVVWVVTSNRRLQSYSECWRQGDTVENVPIGLFPTAQAQQASNMWQRSCRHGTGLRTQCAGSGDHPAAEVMTRDIAYSIREDQRIGGLWRRVDRDACSGYRSTTTVTAHVNSRRDSESMWPRGGSRGKEARWQWVQRRGDSERC